ncbi:uncharacterized protein C8Q71DRAFT_702663 [Rhodofomes roseus]|uniref:Fork-head domain-containing protein n=1 Tax=Rhodofomes roseus TaxID=34475 RepID=A0ABQ8KNP0_9APHY|nr:uncharacterized protein C8Q71DRAFT_702663 [Rhodofomes roseus]KAH9839813.1 hypothetical protein C8Q71DRAFT_702663 [Rhodofomes roseus]
MAAFMAGGRPPSPVDEILKNMNLTREDLARHSEQMRLFLTGGADCASSSTFPTQPSKHNTQTTLSRKSSSRAISRSSSVVNTFGRAASPSPSRVHVKPEPFEEALPTRSLGTMELVLERKSRQSRERRCMFRRTFAWLGAHKFFQPPMHVLETTDALKTKITPQTPHHYRHYSERVLGDAFASRTALPPFGASDPSTPRPRSRAPGSSRAATPAGRTIYTRTPHRPSSPGSSPTRIINMVSSPGPMRSSPVRPAKEVKLPYVLPLGPYSEDKPDCAYAGLIGQAILSSPEHRLTLQDIYEWITTVYPYYKRGEQTWMNSVRHCLSTMAVFRKVPRVRNEGKSLWAVFDEDVPAFANGGFKKSLCPDMVKLEKEKQAKRGPRKRGAATDDNRNTKRHKSEHVDAEGSRPAAPPPMLPPYFPPFHANPHHQPYYQAYAPHAIPAEVQAIPAEVVFPPLPPNAGFATSVSRPASVRPTSSGGSAARPVSAAGSVATEASIVRGRDRSPKPISSSSSVPALTPNCSSSSSPPLSFHASMMDDARYSSSPALSPAVAFMDTDDEEDELDVEWLHRGPPIAALAPSATLLRPADFNTSRRSKSKQQRDARKRPSPSLVHYKSHLDPPPPSAMHFPQAPLLAVPGSSQMTPPRQTGSADVHTPLRKVSGTSDNGHFSFSPFAPVTPQRLTYPNFDSPWRTPSRSTYDLHAPSSLLDEELHRQSLKDISPSLLGLGGRPKGLWDSPLASSSPSVERFWG